jgi:hypothetical protein
VSDEIKRLADLHPEARSRVEAALKEALDREVVSGNLGGPAAAGNIFSRGWIFSRLTPTAMDTRIIRELPGLAKMGPDEFATFASRLAEMKRQGESQR